MHRRSYVSIVLVLLSGPAGAERLQFGGRSEVFWTDNAFVTVDEETDVGEAVRAAPWADLEDREGRVTWGLRYEPIYDYYLDQRELRGFDHDVGGRFAWQLGDRTRFSASERFQRYHSVSAFNDQAAPGDDIVPVGQRQRFKVNNITGSLDHQIGPLDLVTLSVFHTLYDYSDEDQLDYDFLGTNLSYTHTLSERTSVGTRLSWNRQTRERFDDSDAVTDYYNLSGLFTYAISRTSQLSLSAGPALIQGNSDDFEPAAEFTVRRFPLRRESGGNRFLDATTCPEEAPGVFVVGPSCDSVGPVFTGASGTDIVPFVGAVPSVEDSNTTYFASATLSKQWEHWSGALSYTRSAGQSSTVASVSDIVFGNLSWRISRRLTANLSASYERRGQANESFVLSQQVVNVPSPDTDLFDGDVAQAIAVRAVEVDSGTGVDVVVANLRVAYQLARRTSLYASVGWREQSFTGDASAVGSADRLSLNVGFNYSFEPVNF